MTVPYHMFLYNTVCTPIQYHGCIIHYGIYMPCSVVPSVYDQFMQPRSQAKQGSLGTRPAYIISHVRPCHMLCSRPSVVSTRHMFKDALSATNDDHLPKHILCVPVCCGASWTKCYIATVDGILSIGLQR